MMPDNEMVHLKQQWQRDVADQKPPQISMQHIRSQARQTSLAALKKSYRRHIILLIVMVGLIVNQFRNKDFLHSIFFWAFVFFCFCLVIFLYANMRNVKRLTSSDNPLTTHLRIQVNLLKQRMRFHLAFTRGAVLLFFILVEVLAHFTESSMLLKWHAIHPMLRIAAYLAFLTFQFFVGKRLAYERYGQHLERLQEILNDSER